MEEISDYEAQLFEDKCTFLSLFHSSSDHFDMDSHDFDFDTLRKKTNIKRKLTQKFGALLSYRRKSFCY